MKICVPIEYSVITAENKDFVLDYLKKSKVSNVFLVFMADENLDTSEESIDHLRFIIDFLSQNGIESTIWTNAYIGHGGVLSHDVKQTKTFTEITSKEGNVISGNFCPLDPEFVKTTTNLYKKLVSTGVRNLLLDDDFRMSGRGGSLNCCCKLHLDLMSKYCKEEVTREKICKYAFVGKPNKYRNAWLKAQGEGLYNYARAIRKAIDEIDPTVRISACSSISPWNVDGADPRITARILAGNGNKPFLRLVGAPYGYYSNSSYRSFIQGIEEERMFYSFCNNDTDIEYLSEIDSYPRPRYKVPAISLEIYDAILRADGKYDGTLKYMSDYSTPFEYDTGYFDSHIKNLSQLEKIEEFFKDGEIEGIRAYAYPFIVENADYPEDFNANTFLNSTGHPFSLFLSELSVPTSFDGNGITGFVCGEHTRKLNLADIKNGAVLDGNAAKILHERGVDVGFSSILSYGYHELKSENYSDKSINVGGSFRLLSASLNSNAEILSTAKTVDGNEIVTAYRYENSEGKRFLVFTFYIEEILSRTVFTVNYYRQQQVFDGIEWISRKKLPVKLYKNHDAYVLCKRTKNSLKVGIFNCYLDEIINPTFELDKQYSSITFLNSCGKLEKDRVTTEDIPPFKYVCFEVFD